MRIAQVSQLFESTPPIRYGGTERVVSWLTESLVRQGHEVTLFATGDSKTSAKLVPVLPECIRHGANSPRDWVPVYARLLEEVRRVSGEFDIIHFHIDSLPLPVFAHTNQNIILTMHGRLDLKEYHDVYRLFPKVPLVSISNSQRSFMPDQNWAGTIYHGMPEPKWHVVAPKRKYLAFLGRISPEKGVEHAISIALSAGLDLKIAAKIDRVDKEYFNKFVKPYIGKNGISFLGEITDSEKPDFLGNAKALLFPIDWPEPFGLAMVEALAVGTPVIGFRRGSVPEIVDDGVTGFVVNSVQEAVSALEKIPLLDSEEIKKVFLNRFTDHRMAEEYAKIYQDIINADSGDVGT